MVNDNGRVAVIDFDKAELYASESSKKREMLYVNHILDGLYQNRDVWSSECTPQPSRYRDFRRGSSGSRSGPRSEYVRMTKFLVPSCKSILERKKRFLDPS
jgi:hypothetical protein